MLRRQHNRIRRFYQDLFCAVMLSHAHARSRPRLCIRDSFLLHDSSPDSCLLPKHQDASTQSRETRPIARRPLSFGNTFVIEVPISTLDLKLTPSCPTTAQDPPLSFSYRSDVHLKLQGCPGTASPNLRLAAFYENTAGLRSQLIAAVKTRVVEESERVARRRATNQ